MQLFQNMSCRHKKEIFSQFTDLLLKKVELASRFISGHSSGHYVCSYIIHFFLTAQGQEKYFVTMMI